MASSSSSIASARSSSPPPTNPRSRTSRNRGGGSRPPAPTSSRRRSPSPDGTLGPWDAISRENNPPPGHPNRPIRVTTDIGTVDFSCYEARTAEDHREQLAYAEDAKQRIVACGERYIRALQQGSDGDIHDTFRRYTQWLVLLAGIELHVACLKRSQRGDRGVWGSLREISDDPDRPSNVIED
ncbi:hypothetical protein LB507_006084 [Fusarium sp. FIESC RH6]|nr:hypothetical protein LB507_006084 [Fusarium sp. FIESC RH6]